MTQQEVKELIVATFGSQVLPGGFSADIVASFYCRYLQGRDEKSTPTTASLNAFINRCQGW
ncbi:hypothetical protein [Candidatus Cyanaurora vandensis]|uniref:hypothetical protein n=1 Tax=Candidatus Cyanaurora vandensis TaxID=2714958 RepID=UPI00257CD73C|nr:hypothetical protein [Candidatus Cyanaurora vandensis]